MSSSTSTFTSTSTSTSPTPRRPRRESRFTEGSYTTSSPTTTLSPDLSTILSEQDSYEARQQQQQQRRRRGDSNSSSDSLASSSGSGSGSAVSSSPKESLPRRSITFARGYGRERESERKSVDGGNVSGNGNGVRRSLDERPWGDLGVSGVGGVAMKVKGRLRALTGERRKDGGGVKPYPGT